MIEFNNTPDSTKTGGGSVKLSVITNTINSYLNENPSVITDAVNDYLDEHPVSGADVPTTDIDFSNWDERGIN